MRLHLVQAGGRFIEKDELGAGGEGPEDFQRLLFSQRQASGGKIGPSQQAAQFQYLEGLIPYPFFLFSHVRKSEPG